MLLTDRATIVRASVAVAYGIVKYIPAINCATGDEDDAKVSSIPLRIVTGKVEEVAVLAVGSNVRSADMAFSRVEWGFPRM